MISLIKENNELKTASFQYIVDKTTEISSLPTENVPIHSIAFCIEEKSFYILSGDKIWIKVN